jgi:hypothetical protein
MWQDAIVAADPHFNCVQYDTNGGGIISAEELTVIVVRPQNSPYGTVRGVDATVDGTTLTFDLVDAYILAHAADRVWNVGILSHIDPPPSQSSFKNAKMVSGCVKSVSSPGGGAYATSTCGRNRSCNTADSCGGDG